MVSIITPVYNRAELLIETAQSVFNQTYTNWEWIIVDDGSSTDCLHKLEILANQDQRIKLLKRTREPKGACACRNIGVEKAKGSYIIFLDSDDLLEPVCLGQRVKAMDSAPIIDFGIFPSLMFDKKPFDLGLWWNIDKDTDELTRQFHQDAICQTTGVMWRMDAFIRTGGWNEELHLWQDIELFLRVYIQDYKYKKFFELPPDLHNRVNQSSLSRGIFFAIDKQLSRIKVIKLAVELLKKYHKIAYIREARFITAEIISGLLRTQNYNEATALYVWAAEEKVINWGEMKKLKKMKMFYIFKLYKLRCGKKYILKLNGIFSTDSTVGILPYKN